MNARTKNKQVAASRQLMSLLIAFAALAFALMLLAVAFARHSSSQEVDWGNVQLKNFNETNMVEEKAAALAKFN
jgi:hypothetical protein